MACSEDQVPTQQPTTKEQYWRDRIEQWQASGQTVRVFCAEHALSEPSFYSWRRTNRLRDQDGVLPPVDCTMRPRSAARPTFVPVRIVSPGKAPAGVGGLELTLAMGRTIRIAPDFDPATLRRLLAVLEEPASC